MDVLFLTMPIRTGCEVILGFRIGARPNLPCMREDGSYNMVADDGRCVGRRGVGFHLVLRYALAENRDSSG